MKRNSYYFLIVLFILSACQPSPAGQGQPATVTQGANATMIPTSSWTPEPTPTEETLRLINTINIEAGSTLFSECSRVSLEDFLSGKLLKAEIQWIEEHPFSEKTVPFKDVRILEVDFIISSSTPTTVGEDQWEARTTNIVFTRGEADYSDLEIRPIKIISFYVLWDYDLFEKIGITEELINSKGWKIEWEYAQLGIVSWALLNPDRTTTIGHTLINMQSSQFLEFIDRDVFNQGVEYNYKELIPNSRIDPGKYVSKIYELYPKIDPLDLSKKWTENDIMPKELEKKLFFTADITSLWNNE